MTAAEIQPYQFGETTALQLASNTTMSRGDRVREWLQLFIDTEKVATVLAQTDFVPTTMKGKPAQVAAAMMKGYELDIDPLDALGNIFSVHGRIGFYAEFMRRRIIQAGHEFRVIEASDTRVVVEGRRNGSDDWQRASFTAAQAKNAKIDLGGYPEDKLIARATSRLCKRAFPDVLSGAAIVEDLLDDPQAATVRIVTERPDRPVELDETPAAGTVQRKRQPRKTAAVKAQPSAAARPVEDSADAPPLDGDDTEQPASDSGAKPDTSQVNGGEQPCTRDQQVKLNILLENEEAIGKDRASKLGYLEAQFGRKFTSSKDLTLHEASQLIDFLEKAQADDQNPPMDGDDQ